MSEDSTNDGLVLTGLDGANPLGFLAALGVLRLLSADNEVAKMSWHFSNSAWRPQVYGVEVPLPAMGAQLHAAIHGTDHSAWSIDKRLPFEAHVLRERSREAGFSATRTSRQFADSLASFGVEFFVDKDGTFENTALCMVRAGDAAGQGLLAYGKRIFESTTSEQLQRCVELTWQSIDNQCALRWDPSEDKPYAMQWRNPSKIGAFSEKGANCLALFGMACLPVIPARGQAETTGFGLKAPKQTSFTWPIWRHPITLDVASSLLTSAELQQENPDRTELDSLGVATAYRCNRVMTSTYYANFTPSRRVA